MITQTSEITNLYAMPTYTNGNGNLYGSFNEALSKVTGPVTYDLSSMLSMVSFHHPCGDNTLIREITKNPWMSVADQHGIHLCTKPPHGYRYASKSDISKNFFRLLVEEMTQACQGYKEGFILLSGGLDSRILACAVYEGIKRGQIKTKFTALTWGKYNSRDVMIAEMVSKALEFPWISLELPPSVLARNIDLVARELGCMTNAFHLHGMSWLADNVSKESLVIAGSYGDGIGRAEYSKRHILEIDLLYPINRFGLIKDSCFEPLKNQLMETLQINRQRFPYKHKHEICEVEMQSHYMRNLINHSMSIIQHYTNLYQGFTQKEVYSYMWGIHPSLRNDRIYGEILKTFGKNIAEIPWAMTNRSLSGTSRAVDPTLSSRNNLYREWITRDIYDELHSRLDFDLFNETGIFDRGHINDVCAIIRKGSEDYHVYNVFLWLVGFSKFNALLKDQGINVTVPEIGAWDKVAVRKPVNKASWKSIMIKKMVRFSKLRKLFRKLRKKTMILLFLIRHLPEKG